MKLTKILIPLFVIALMLVVVGCSSSSAPNIQATIESGVRATRVAENYPNRATDIQQAIDATISASAPTPTSSVSLLDKIRSNENKYYNEGVGYTEQELWAESIESYNKAIEPDSAHVGAYYNRGLQYAKLGKHQRAIEDYDKVIALNPDYATAYRNRGLVFQDVGQYELANDDLRRACELDQQYC